MIIQTKSSFLHFLNVNLVKSQEPIWRPNREAASISTGPHCGYAAGPHWGYAAGSTAGDHSWDVKTSHGTEDATHCEDWSPNVWMATRGRPGDDRLVAGRSARGSTICGATVSGEMDTSGGDMKPAKTDRAATTVVYWLWRWPECCIYRRKSAGKSLNRRHGCRFSRRQWRPRRTAGMVSKDLPRRVDGVWWCCRRWSADDQPENIRNARITTPGARESPAAIAPTAEVKVGFEMKLSVRGTRWGARPLRGKLAGAGNLPERRRRQW